MCIYIYIACAVGVFDVGAHAWEWPMWFVRGSFSWAVLGLESLHGVGQKADAADFLKGSSH